MSLCETLSPPPSSLALPDFLDRYANVVEHSPWVAEKAWQQGMSVAQDTPDGLAERLGKVLMAAPREEQIDVIRAHPDLAGKAALAGELTRASLDEQAGAGLDQCSPDELARFERLNAAYKARFGFPFVVAVKGLDRHAILAAFEERLTHDEEQERETAITQIIKIVRLRLHTMTAAASA